MRRRLMRRGSEGRGADVSRFDFVSRGPGETQDLGRLLGRLAEPGFIYLLQGELGAGKTCLTQGILWGLGADEYARSPTFVLMNRYEGRLTLHHIDLYRIGSDQEVADLGLDEYFYGDGLSVVEWADRATAVFPEEHLYIRIDPVDAEIRNLTLSASSRRHARLIDDVRARTGLK